MFWRLFIIRNPKQCAALFAACVACVVLAGLCAAPAGATAPLDRLAESLSADELVGEALFHEVSGLDGHRNALLAMAREKSPRHAPALWHAGYVNRNRKWLSLEEATESSTVGSLAGYLQRRSDAPDTLAGHLELADWCRQRKLADRERAHLTRVLEFDPNHAVARSRLGYRQIDGAWFSPEEMAAAARQRERTAASLAEWKPRLEKLVAAMDDESRQRQSKARERLLAIKDPGAVAAIEALLARGGKSQTALAVEMLAGIEGKDAALALARISALSPHLDAAEAAASALATRDRTAYVPAMLASTSAPIQSRAQLYRTPAGRLNYRHLFYREAQYGGSLAVLDTDYGRAERRIDPATQSDAVVRAAFVEQTVALQNAAIERTNKRIAWALSIATGEELPNTPEGLWQWWNDENEVYVPEEKPVTVAYQQAYVRPPDSVMSVTECLAAGTPVWTETGTKPIEQIRVGDLVLAQDPDTGRLDFKPVLRTTHRAPEPLVRLQMGEESITASGGHAFWISGDGWVKARDLAPGMPVHSVRGTASVEIVEPSRAAPTYNLVVADFHTFFVGQAKLLTHDNTIPEATDRLVPGLVAP